MEDRPNIYLKRAWGLINEVEKAADTFRQRAIQHDAQVQEDQPFVGGLVNMLKSAGKLKREKSSILSDLELAKSEIDKAATLNPGAVICIDSTDFDIVALRATILYLRGQIEMIWGKPERAQDIWVESINLRDFADPHYMLGLVYEDEYNPKEALNHFERCLELDPDGELSVPALREANAMRKYKKKFRGSWPLFGLMFLFFFPVAIVYLVVKYK